MKERTMRVRLQTHRCLAVAIAFTVCAGCAPKPGLSRPSQPTDAKSSENAGKTLAQLFEGRFNGISVTPVSNSSVRIVIRNARNSDGSPGYPLYVVDGSPIAAPDGVLSMNPNDVAKIEVLKDDASALLYGQQAANGVIKITTKRK
jgi:TonB-dependent SusC/RagA subfamily outer membrane receptor